MSSLTCQFSDKVRFYEQVLKENQQSRIFVETDEDLSTGTEVEVDIFIGKRPKPMKTTGKVVGKRTKSGAAEGAAGVWVSLDPKRVDVLRQALDLDLNEAGEVSSRLYPRYERKLEVILNKPLKARLQTRDIGQGGVCLDGIVPVPVNQTVQLAVDFGGELVAVYGRIAWRREEMRQTGIEFRFQNDETRQKVLDQVRRIGEAHDWVVLAKPSVLIVDDDVATLKALDRVLTVRGYGTMTARTGPEAMVKARENHPSLILLDVLLPGMNGVEVCRALKRDVETSRIPVALTSVMSPSELGMMVKEGGALAALQKPYRVETLATLVESVLDQNKALVADPDKPRAHNGSSPVFLRAFYESETLHVEGHLRNASSARAFFVTYWGDNLNTEGKLTVFGANLENPVQLDVKVLKRVDWGIISGQPGQLPGMEIEIAPSDAQKAFAEWLAAYEDDLQKKPIIVIVDDDSAQLEILSVILKHEGYAVVTLDSPMAVPSAVELAQPALVIIDYMMPEMDGGKLCKLLKESPATRDTMVWLYSSLSEDHLRLLAKDAGADGSFQKGLRPSELAKLVKEALN